MEALKKLIEALPTVDDVKEMTTEEANEVYQQTQEAYDAYDSLSDADKKLADGDRITALLEYFNTLVAPVEDVPVEVSSFEQLKSNVENGISVKLTENISAGAGDIYYNSGNTITIEMGEHTITGGFWDIGGGTVNFKGESKDNKTAFTPSFFKCSSGHCNFQYLDINCANGDPKYINCSGELSITDTRITSTGSEMGGDVSGKDFSVYGTGKVLVSGNSTLSGFILYRNASLSINEGATLTLNASESWISDMTITNNGTLNIGAKVTLTSSNVTVNGTGKIWNYGKIEGTLPEVYAVTIQSNGNGTASATPNAATQGATITLSATPAQGYYFKEWQVESGDVTISDNSFTMPASAVAVKAIFELTVAPSITTQPQNATVTAGQTATFTVAAAGTPTPTYQWQVDKKTGSYVNIEKATSASYTTSAVDINCSGYKYRCVVTNSAGSVNSREATMTVNPITYAVTVQTDGNGTASATPDTAAQGTVISLSANAKDGYQFKEWQVVNGSVSIRNNSFFMPASAVTIKAVFEKKETTPIKPTKPQIGDKTGWDEIEKDIINQIKDTTSTSDKITITIDMNETTEVPRDVIDAIKDKNVDLVIDLGNGIQWTINGNDVTSSDVGNIDLGVNVGSTDIPVDVINTITGEKTTIQISLSHNGEFGFTATLTVNMDEKNVGYYANLFYYNKEGKLEFMNAGKIDASGNINLTFSHASDYAIVIADKVLDGKTETTDTPKEEEPTPETTLPSTGDNTPIWRYVWMLVIGSMVILVGIGSILYKKRKDENEK